MNRQNQIENELKQLDGGSFQKLAEAYVYRKLRLKSITALGSQPGTNKPTKGIPDAHSLTDCEAILIPFTTAQCDSFQKLKRDIKECVSIQIPKGYGRRIVCCHLVWRLTIEQENELTELNPQIELLGPKTIAEDLAHEYCDLAADFLHIRVETGALVTPNEWVQGEERKNYATPQSGSLRYRSNELDKLEKTFDQIQILVLYGPSGSGKTRLALEAVKHYAHKKRIASYVLSQIQNPSVAEDINEFLSRDDAVILVDDAQPSEGLDAILDAAVKNQKLQVILTVRNYNFEQLMHSVRRSVRSKTYPLQQLDDKYVKKILQEDYAIPDSPFLEKIGKIARGNLRLAIMAALCAKRDGYLSITNAYEIMDLFYSTLIDGLEKEDLILLSYLSIYAPCDFKEGDLAYEGLLSEGMSQSSVERRTRKLHDRNILDLLDASDGTIAVKFEQLNLQDYCIYKAIFKEHIINLHTFIGRFIIRNRQKVVRILNILISIFGDDATLSCIRSECAKVWKESEQRSGAERYEIMDVLHPLIPDEAYRFALSEIGKAPTSPIPLFKRGNYLKQTVGTPPVCLAILCELRNFELYPNAIPALLDSVKRGCFELKDYRSLIEGPLAITVRSVASEFKYEQTLLDELRQMIDYESDTCNLQYFGMKLCEQYLALSHTSSEIENGNSIRYTSFTLPHTKSSLNLRSNAITFLCNLLNSSDYRTEAAKVLSSYVGVCNKATMSEDIRFFLKSGIQAFTAALPSKYIPGTLEECELIYHCFLTCKAFSMPEYETMSSLLPQEYYDRAKLMENFSLDDKELASLTEDWNIQRYKNVLSLNWTMWKNQKLDSYHAGSLIDRVFVALLTEKNLHNNVEKMFIFFCHLHDGDQKITLGTKIIEKLAQRIGWRALLRQAHLHKLSSVIATAVAVAPSTALTDNDLNCLIAATKSGQVLLFIDTVMDIELKSAGFAKKYCEAAYEWLLAKTEYANRFFLPLFRSNNSTTILNTCFGNCEDALQKIYETHILDDNFDYFAVLFKFLDEKGNNPVDILFNCLANVSDVSNRYKIIRRLGHVPQLYNPEQRLRKVVHRLVSCSRFSAYDVSTLLINNEYLLENFDVSDFIFTELERGLQEGCVPECYSEALLYIPLSKRKEPYINC